MIRKTVECPAGRSMLIRYAPMRTETRTLEWFLADPRCRKWIVQCNACRMYGRKPETPASVPKYRFEEMFPFMPLDGHGRCPACSRSLGQNGA